MYVSVARRALLQTHVGVSRLLHLRQYVLTHCRALPAGWPDPSQAVAVSEVPFANLFRQDLPPDLFVSILSTLCEACLPAGLPTAPVLQGLAQVPRVATTVMFLDNSEKVWLETLLGPQGGLPDDVIARLKKQFGL